MRRKGGLRSVFRISLTNATILSALYLTVAVVVEVVRRLWSPRWAERLSLAFEVFPARALAFLGLFEPIRRAWMQGRLSDGAVRVLYGATTVGLVFAAGLLVGAGMWLVLQASSKGGDDRDADGD